MYSLKPLKHINTNARLNIKIEVKKVGLEMTLEFKDVCHVPNVCWQRVLNRWTSHWKRAFSKFGVGQWNCTWSSPYYEDMWRRYCCLTSFFLTVDIRLSCEDTAQQNCAMVPRWQFFASFLRPLFPASCMQHISDLHPKLALRPHHV